MTILDHLKSLRDKVMGNEDLMIAFNEIIECLDHYKSLNKIDINSLDSKELEVILSKNFSNREIINLQRELAYKSYLKILEHA